MEIRFRIVASINRQVKTAAPPEVVYTFSPRFTARLPRCFAALPSFTAINCLLNSNLLQQIAMKYESTYTNSLLFASVYARFRWFYAPNQPVVASCCSRFTSSPRRPVYVLI